MHDSARAIADALGHLVAAQRCGEGQVPTGQRLADAHDVGCDADAFGRPEGAGASETGGDLVEDDERPVLTGEFGEESHALRVVDPHAAGALQQGFEDDGRDVVGVLGEQARGLVLPRGHLARVSDEAGRRVRGCGRQRREDLLGQRAAPERVHTAVGVADAHRVQRVAVVAAADGEDATPWPVVGGEALQRHLHCHLDADGARIGEEHSVQRRTFRLWVRRHRDEALGEPDRGFVRQTAEHDVRHAL